MADLFWQKDSGFKSMIAQFKINKGETAALVGFLKSASPYVEGQKAPMTVAQVAANNEFGSSNTPERSFFRSTMAEQKKKLMAMAKKYSNKVLSKQMDNKTALGLMAEFLVLQLKNKIQSNLPPPNAPSTIRAKGSSKTLIDHGHMRDSVDWEIKKG